MSGYRNLHREQVNKDGSPVWQVQSSTLSCKEWCVWAAAADGFVRVYRVKEKDTSVKSDDLDAAALSIECTHVLLARNQVFSASSDQSLVGSSQVSIVRNYVGDDENAGDWVVASLQFDGRVRVWTFPPEEIGGDSIGEPKQIRASHEFIVQNATGTIMKLCPPKLSGRGNIVLAVASQDGMVHLIATGITTLPKSNSPQPGTVLERWGSVGASIPLSMSWHPTNYILCVGRHNGTLDIMLANRKGHHRLQHHSAPIRAVAFTPDGELLISGDDSGFLAVWDMNRHVPSLVHHRVEAHSSWILSVVPLADSRRFVTCGADQKIHVWLVSQMDAPMHSFQSDSTVWTMHANSTRLTTGSENGWLQVYSLET